MWLFAFILFGILGWCEFVKPVEGNAKMFFMIVFIVLMLLWALVGVTGYELPLSFRK